MRKSGLLIIIVLLFFFASCSKPKSEKSSDMLVFTSILPQQFFLQQIGGDKIEVEVMVQPGKSPATYEPLPNQVMRLSEAVAFFSIGVPFEKAFLPKIATTLPKLKIINTAAGIDKRYLQNHTHTEDHDYDHKLAEDPHIWLSPLLVKSQAQVIYENLAQLDPENADYYRDNYLKFIQKLQQLHQKLSEIMKPLTGKTLLVFHPSFGYFTDLYGLQQVAIESGGKQPSPAHLQQIIQQAKELKAKTIITQPEFSQKSAQVIAQAINGTVISLNPLDPDYFNNLKKIALTIADSYK